MNYSFSSEAVSIGHPDKICDQISDAILDAYLQDDPHAKVAVECLITSQKLIIAGEVQSSAQVDAVSIAKQVLLQIGYTSLHVGFDTHTADYENLIHQQSPLINNAVIDGGAGDQGVMFGYATNESENLLPLPYLIAQELIMQQQLLRQSTPWLLPDAKAQVTFQYKNNLPTHIEKIVLSTQHTSEISFEQLKDQVKQLIISPCISPWINPDIMPDYYINPSGSFLLGGPHSDTGLTGRKIIVDTYGGSCPHGGGAFSGKDSSKVDRSAAYAARFAAKQVVWSGLAERCTVQLAYAIGLKEPQSIYVNTHQTSTIADEKISAALTKAIDFTPLGIIDRFDLRQAIYQQTAQNGHFTHPGLPWEKRDEDIINNLQMA